MLFRFQINICLLALVALTVFLPHRAFPDSFSEKTQLKITSSVTNPIEILFQLALNEVKRGHYRSAIEIFKSLEKSHSTPRIQLELARALFLDRRYQESQALFRQLSVDPEIPWAVRENIQLYLDAIDDALGRVNFSFSLVSDSNPRNFTESRQVRIFGQLMTIVPPKDNQEIRGIRYSLSAAKDLFGNGTVKGYLDLAFSDYEMSQFDRWVVDSGFSFAPRRTPKFRFKTGVEESFYGGEHLYDFPYIGIVFVPQPVYEFKTHSELKIGELRVPNARGFDATNLTLTTKALRKTSDNSSLLCELYLEKSTAEEDFYSYYGGALGAELGWELSRSWVLSPFVSVSRRVYEERNPLFGRVRQDIKSVIGLKMTKADFRVADFVPELVFRYDENRSNISYYSYDKTSVLLNWSR